MKLEQIQMAISGRVQGVGFRYHTKHEADRISITGWVRNMADGSVEVLAEGTSEQLETFMKVCRQGPPASRVAELTVRARTPIEALTHTAFQVKQG